MEMEFNQNSINDVNSTVSPSFGNQKGFELDGTEQKNIRLDRLQTVLNRLVFFMFIGACYKPLSFFRWNSLHYEYRSAVEENCFEWKKLISKLEKMMDISIHTEVRCQDGLVGKSTHIIVDLVTEQVTHIVLKAKGDGQEYLVPIEKIRTTDKEAILLDCNKDDISELTAFHEMYFNGYDSYSGTPPLPSAGMGASYTLYHPYRTSETGVDEASLHPARVQLAVNKGAEVLATDGRVGKIDELVIDPKTHQVTHLILRQHHLINVSMITIPVTEIERAEMDMITLKINKEEVAALPTVTLKKYPWE